MAIIRNQNKIKPRKLKEGDIQLGLFHHFYTGRKCAIPNTFNAYGEADLINFTRSNQMCEYEIKVSKSDFKADFKHKQNKHAAIKWCFENRKKENRRNQVLANYFSYVCPTDLIKLDEVPEYAGLYYARWVGMSSPKITQIKRPPRLHKYKWTEAEINKKLAALYWKYWNLRKTINEYHFQYEPWLPFMGNEEKQKRK